MKSEKENIWTMNNEIDAHLPEHDDDDDEKLEKFDENWRDFVWESEAFA